MSGNTVNPQAFGAQAFADKNAVNKKAPDLGIATAFQKLAEADVLGAFGKLEGAAAPQLPRVLGDKPISMFFNKSK